MTCFQDINGRRVKVTCEGVAVAPAHGPGTELTKLFRELGIKPKSGCNCKALAAWMDRIGVAGCRKARDTLARLREKAGQFTWTEKVTAAFRAVSAGIIVNPADPFPGLIDLAIERAAAESPQGPSGSAGKDAGSAS